MKANTGDKAFFLFMAEMFHLDPDDKLELEEHNFLQRAMCVTHLETRRSFTVHRRVYGCEFDYINGNGNVTEQIIDDPIVAAERAMAFLNRTTDQI
jgi:hypothetical protein